MLEAEMVVDFDEDDDRKYDRLIELAVEHSREVIESNPRQALQGLKVIIRGEDGKMLFEVKFGPKELGLTLH